MKNNNIETATLLNSLKCHAETILHGILIFGSRAKGTAGINSDLDIGLIYSGPPPGLRSSPGKQEPVLDLFVWSLDRWNRGFALQLELCQTARILFDPEGVVSTRLEKLREELDPAWFRLLKRL